MDIRWTSERIDEVEDLREPAAIGLIGDIAAPGEFDLRVGKTRRSDGVVGADIGAPHETRDVEMNLFVVDHDHLRPLDEEVAVRHLLRDAHRDISGQKALAAGGAVALKIAGGGE